MRLHAIIVGSLAAVAIVVAGSQTANAQTPETQNITPIVKVQPGNTLSGIAKDHGTTYVRLYDANAHIVSPDQIYPGQDVRIPAADEQLVSRTAPVAVAPKATVAPAPKPATRSTAAPADSNISGGVWDRLAQCESGGRWNVNTGNGYYGGLQFSLSSWRAVGGSGLPSDASKSEQISRAEMLKARQGWGAWPACTTKLGLR